MLRKLYIIAFLVIFNIPMLVDSNHTALTSIVAYEAGELAILPSVVDSIQ